MSFSVTEIFTFMFICLMQTSIRNNFQNLQTAERYDGKEILRKVKRSSMWQCSISEIVFNTDSLLIINFINHKEMKTVTKSNKWHSGPNPTVCLSCRIKCANVRLYSAFILSLTFGVHKDEARLHLRSLRSGIRGRI